MNELQPNNPELGMKDFLAVLRRRIWLILPILLLCIGGAYLYYLKTPKTWRAESQMMLIQSIPSAVNSVSGVETQPAESIETQMGLIKSRAVADRAAFTMNNGEGASPGDPRMSIDDVLSRVKVTNPMDSNVLDIAADGSSREQAVRLARAMDSAFKALKHETARRNFRDAEKNLSVRAERAKQEMILAEQKETAFKQAHHLADVDAAEKSAIAAFDGTDTTVTQLNAELAAQDARVKELDARLAAANAAVNSGNGVPDEALVLSLQNKLRDLQAQRADAATKFTKDYPGVFTQLDSGIAQTKAQLAQALKATSNNAAPSLASRSALAQADSEAHVQQAATLTRLASAVQARQQYQTQMQAMPGLQLQYDQLFQNKGLATQLFTQLQAALNATRLQEDQIQENVTVTQEPLGYSQPYKPDLKTSLMLGLALGALLSLGLVMLLEQLDQRVRTLDEIRALASGPIIGMLPKTSRAQMNAMAQGQLLPEFEEAFSLVRVNLSYVLRHSMMREQVQHQTILVTSAVPGEGKSVTAAELARTMAEAGKSVILVDANLRRPAQNVLFQTGETGGLSDVLSGHLPLDEAIATSDVENLSILHSGASDLNPTVLLSQPRLAAVMEALRFKADVVIVDAPDCSSVADTLLLTAHADCLLQVVRAGSVDMDTLHNASLALQATGKKVTILANGLNRPQQRAFKTRFAYSALSSQSETPALPQSFEKTMVMNRSRDLVFSKSARKSLETPADAPDKNEAP